MKISRKYMKELTSCFSFLIISLKLYIFLPNLKSRESLMRNKLSKSPIFERLVFQRYNAMKIYSSPVREMTLVIYHTHKIIIDQLANRWLIQDANE